jgi:mRNA interferase MazF
MKKGSIILTALPQQDGQLKQRPVLILKEMPAYGDFLVCGVSSQINQYVVNFDEILNQGDDDYKQSGIIKPSVIRLSFLAVIPKKSIAGSIGKISDSRYNKLIKNLTDYLNK